MTTFEKETALREMARKYNTAAAAHTYALGFVYGHKLYVVKLSFAELSLYFKLDRASSKKGGMLKIRIRMTATQKAELSLRAEELGAEDLLEKDSKHNKGENFERELTERWTAEEWVKDSIPFTVAGDIRVDGIEIQVKLDGAELTNEKALKNLVA